MYILYSWKLVLFRFNPKRRKYIIMFYYAYTNTNIRTKKKSYSDVKKNFTRRFARVFPTCRIYVGTYRHIIILTGNNYCIALYNTSEH